MTLREILISLESFTDDHVIVARKDGKWDLSAPAALIPLEEFIHSSAEIGEMTYFLEVELAKEVIDVWRSWRPGKEPTLNERLEAIIHYAENDAYIS